MRTAACLIFLCARLSSVESEKCTASFQTLQQGPTLSQFISFSAPLETWKEHSHFLELVNGQFVLNGIPNNSFDELAQKLLELRQQGILASIVIDPTAFEKHQIEAVPTLILADEINCDKISGNIPIPVALRMFEGKGDLSAAASLLLKQIGDR